MPFFSIMQGRLLPPEPGRFQSFPREQWRDEFELAARVGLNGIEWIFDLYGEAVNPIGSDAGIDQMRALSQQSGIAVRSVCADYFMDRPFLRCPENERKELIQKFEWLLARGRLLQIRRIVIPFVDTSRIENRDDEATVISILRALLPAAETNNIELHLETSLSPERFESLLDRCSHPLVRANYDSGNSASLGYNVADEFKAYGDRIGSVHVKDRKFGGGTVPLGTGDADLQAVFQGLAVLNYPGDYVLQIARSEPGDEFAWIAKNLSWVAGQVEAAMKVGA